MSLRTKKFQKLGPKGRSFSLWLTFFILVSWERAPGSLWPERQQGKENCFPWILCTFYLNCFMTWLSSFPPQATPHDAFKCVLCPASGNWAQYEAVTVSVSHTHTNTHTHTHIRTHAHMLVTIKYTPCWFSTLKWEVSFWHFLILPLAFPVIDVLYVYLLEENKSK